MSELHVSQLPAAVSVSIPPILSCLSSPILSQPPAMPNHVKTTTYPHNYPNKNPKQKCPCPCPVHLRAEVVGSKDHRRCFVHHSSVQTFYATSYANNIYRTPPFVVRKRCRQAYAEPPLPPPQPNESVVAPGTNLSYCREEQGREREKMQRARNARSTASVYVTLNQANGSRAMAGG